jgi:hypothetical protein
VRIALIIVVIALIAGALSIYVVATTPHQSSGVRFPLPRAQRDLLALVPSSADGFALIPTAAAVEGKLRSNPVTRGAIEQWTASQRMPRPWMIGGADLVIWRNDGRTGYALSLDPVRALIVRAYMAVASNADARWNGGVMLINASDQEPMSATDLDSLLAMAAMLPTGDGLAVQFQSGHGAFPPIGRPAVTTARVTAAGITIASRSQRTAGEPLMQAMPAAIQARFPRASLLTATFSAPPRAVEEMNRLVGAKASELLHDGGMIVLYDVETSKLLPRPREVIVLPATPERRAALRDFLDRVAPNAVQQALGFHIETADTGTELLVAFDRDSIARYRADTADSPLLPANAWSMRIDPRRAVPVLQQVADNPGLRFLAPRLFRSARDLATWIEHLQNAEFIEAADSVSADAEELRVVISTK